MSHDNMTIDENDLFADYVTVIEALDPELVTVFDDRTIEAFRELELSLDDDSDEHVYDVARSDAYDFGRLDAYADQLTGRVLAAE